MTNTVKTTILSEHAKAIRALGKQTVENVIEIGYRLTECKSLIKDNGKGWCNWLEREFAWSEKQARNFINVYDLSKSESVNFTGSDLPVSALYLLAAPTTAKEARDEVIARVKRGEKVKHKDIAAMVQKSKKPKTFTGLKAEIVKAVQDAGAKGLTTDQLKILLAPHRHPQTVNSATNALAKADVLRDSGERRETSTGGGRPAIVYTFNPNPMPKPKKKAPAKVVDLNQHGLHTAVVAMLDDNSICKAIEQWAADRSTKERVQKASALVVPLIGNSRSGILKLADEQRPSANAMRSCHIHEAVSARGERMGSARTANDLALHEIVTLATYFAGGDRKHVDTEDVAIKAEEIAPGRFSWRKYKNRIDLELIYKHLWDLTKPDKGGYVTGSKNDGWLMTLAGAAFAEQAVGRLKNLQPAREKRPKREENWMKRERARMQGEAAYAKIREGRESELTRAEAEKFLRLDDYVLGAARARKIQQAEIDFRDDPELGPIVRKVAAVIRGEQ
jgi:hypothetical protein